MQISAPHRETCAGPDCKVKASHLRLSASCIDTDVTMVTDCKLNKVTHVTGLEQRLEGGKHEGRNLDPHPVPRHFLAAGIVSLLNTLCVKIGRML